MIMQRKVLFLFVSLALAGICPWLGSQALATETTQSDNVAIIGADIIEDIETKIELQKQTELVAHELLYILEQEGYFLSHVEQTGEREVEVHLGRIEKITISDFSEKSKTSMISILKSELSEHPRLKEMDRALALINDLHGVSATISFERIDESGSYELVIVGRESRQNGQISIDSVSRSPTGDLRYQLYQTFNGFFTGGDQLRLQGAFVDAEGAPNQKSFFGSYQTPVGSQGAYVELSAGDFRTEVPIEGTSTVVLTNAGFSILPGSATRHDYEGQSAGITLGHPIIRTHDKATYIIGSLDWSDDETKGVGDTENISADVSLFQRTENSLGQSYAYGVTAGFGDTSSFHEGDSGNFRYLQGSFGSIQPIPQIAKHTEFRIELFAQTASNKTPSSKLLGLGSSEFLRGYENSTFLGSTGFRGAVEIAHSYFFDSDILDRVTPLVFLDFGAVRNSNTNVTGASRPKVDSLASVGLGVRADIGYGANAEGFFGVPLLEEADGEVPAPRLYIRLSWGW